MINWIKKNIVIVILVIVILALLKNQIFGTRLYSNSTINVSPKSEIAFDSLSSSSPQMNFSYGNNRQTAPTDTQNRLVIHDTSLSLVVKKVSDTINQVEALAQKNNGFLVNSSLNNPSQSASGTIVVRIPDSSRAAFLESLRQMAIKVVSENISGTDVTDQYVDLDARLTVLNQTKSKFEDILAKATQVQDLLTVQKELINLQSQIDSIKGQQKYYEQSAKLSKITIYLSTDEYSLPYTPSNSWRPEVIFKQAIRSLVDNLRSVGSLTIWLLVYSPIILLTLFLYRFIKRKFFITRVNNSHN